MADLILGRSPDCDVVIVDPSVSGRHARLRIHATAVEIADLDSANGVWIAGQRVATAAVRPGDDVLLGAAPLPWSDPKIARLLGTAARSAGRRGDTVQATITGRAYVCGRCGARGFLPRFVKRAEIQCGSCGAILELGGRAPAPARSRGSRVASALLVLATIAAVTVLVIFGREHIASAVREVGKDTGVMPVFLPEGVYEPPTGSREEAAIRDSGVRDRIVASIDPTAPTTRTYAAQVASRDEGPFHVGQVAAIWSEVREHWSYVNDPRGDEYFARASETIDNRAGERLVGDCDDFAVLLVSMIEAVGGDARLVMSDGELGGHAYAEACIPGEPDRIVTDLRAHYRRARSRQRVTQVHYRSDATCAVWLNLDWSAQVPGGPYGGEDWAVAIHPDGKTETLAPAARTE